MYKEYKRLVYTPPDLLARFCKSKVVERKKIDPICFQEFVFQVCDQEPLCLFNVIEDDCYFLGVHIRLSTRCKIWLTLGLFANYFSLKSLSLSLKSHECALKLTDLRNTNLLFDLNYKIYSWEPRF